MGRFDITRFFVYRYRYWFGYGLITAGLIGALFFAGFFLPGGISETEMASVVASSNVSIRDLDTLAIVNLPYHLLQKISLALFGVSIISIKLPSIILALFSGIGLVLLLRRWFKPNTAVLVSLIAITTGQFLFIAQSGHPGILYLFWSVWLLLMATIIARQKQRNALPKVAFFAIAALSLYTPLSIYMLLAIISAALLHPHLRYLVLQLSKLRLAIGGGVAVILLTPLVLAILQRPALGLELLGIPVSRPDFGANLMSLAEQYLGFSQSGGTTLMTPFFALGSMLIIGIGIYNLVRTRFSAQSYVIMAWIVLLLPVIALNPTFTSITFLPLVLLLASGLNFLLSYWYSLFPRNPYARIGGLIPVIALVGVLLVSGIDRYVYGYRYDPDIVPSFSKDLRLLPDNTEHLVVGKEENDFYQVVAKYNPDLTVDSSPSGESFVATRVAKRDFNGYEVDRIITGSTREGGDRFYVYKRVSD